MKPMHLAALSVAACTLVLALKTSPAEASSHREAPLITQTPKLDGTDFYMFRSYEAGRSSYVTMIANYLPLQDGYGGPNFFAMDDQADYDIRIDNKGTGNPDIIFRFKFKSVDKGIALDIGGKNVPIPLIDAGQIGVNGNPQDNAAQNVLETYTVTMIRGGTSTALTDAATGATVFAKPIDNVGPKTLPAYAAYAQNFIRTVNIPGCGTGKVFVGQRKDPFVVNLGQTFDLVNYQHPVGEQYAKSGIDDLAEKNVTSLALEVPIGCLTNGSDPVIGGWTTSSKPQVQPNGSTMLKQFSRLGNPLVNEVVIGLKDKDTFNASVPADDAQFATYVTNPTAPAIIAAFANSSTPVTAPTAFPRDDLVAVFLTGVKGLNQPAHLVRPAEEMRLNTSIAPTAPAKQSRLGVIGGDNAGYPNGRRPGDDVVDITLRVAMGRLYTLGLFGKPSDAPSGGLDFTDGAYVDASYFDNAFPYVKPPLGG